MESAKAEALYEPSAILVAQPDQAAVGTTALLSTERVRGHEASLNHTK